MKKRRSFESANLVRLSLPRKKENPFLFLSSLWDGADVLYETGTYYETFWSVLRPSSIFST